MSDFDPGGLIRGAGGVFKFGKGVLGKSAVVLGIIEGAIFAAACRIHSDNTVFACLLLGVIAFFVWLWIVLDFSKKRPDIALLEGAEWVGYQQLQASKEFTPSRAGQNAQLAPNVTIASLQNNETDGDLNK